MRNRHLGLIPVTLLLFLCSILLGSVAVAAEGTFEISTGAANGTRLSLQDKSDTGIALQLSIDKLTVSDKDVDGRIFQEFSISGGEVSANIGEPALPIISRLIAVPVGKTLSLKAITENTQLIEGSFLPFPDQGMVDSGGGAFSLNNMAYATDAGKISRPLVEIGQPALMRGVRVVPVTINPVSWDAATGQVTVVNDANLEFILTDSDDENNPSLGDRKIPESFATMYENSVLGYEKTMDTYDGPGTWLIITPSDNNVIDACSPLQLWRQRQGYNVMQVSMGVTGSTNSQIKAYIQNQYDTLDIPLEFVTLVGDANGSVSLPTFRENNTGYAGEGDHQYSQLEGGDVLSDVHVGRISVSSVGELETVINKIVQYETNPDLSDASWYKRAGLAGDPSASGYSTIWISQWTKQQLEEMSYTQIDTIWDGYFLGEMMATINSGESIFTYRGYWNMSGMTSGHIASLNNGQQLPFAVILTCDTGTFENDASCRSEAFLRAANGGGIASIGTATTGTHTRYNNCMYQGIMENVLNSGDFRVGPALTRGKLNMYQNYFGTEPTQVDTWSTWNNLMGDPATAIWTAEPKVLDVAYDATISTGANALPVTVTSDGAPVEGVRVVVFSKGVLNVSGLTDASGRVVLPLSGLIDGAMEVTAYGTNVAPYLGGINVGDVAASVNFAATTIDDDTNGDSMGNDDGLAAPGENVELAIQLGNSGTGGVSSVSATLTSSDPLVTVVQNSATFGYMGSGSQGWGDVPFVLSIDPSCPGGQIIPLELVATDGADSWISLVELEINGSNATFVASDFSTGNLNPGDNASVEVTLENSGNMATSGFSAVLSSTSSWVSVTSADASFGSMAPGAQATNIATPFEISVATGCYPGFLATFSLELTYAEGGTELVEFQATVGTASSTDPVGPDGFGYYAIDNTDTAYDNVPVYDWIEIDPALGGSGTSVGLTDYSRWSDDVQIMDLPFSFNFYGNDFDKISVCSNGWVSMGSSDLRHYRNWTIPSPGGPDNMIAVFWDDLLLQSGTGGVFTYYDEANHRLIIEWSDVRTYEGNVPESFQVFLYDPQFNAGDRGDGRIVMQYKTIQMVDSTTGYATVGIQNEDRDDGLLYTYWNRYPGGAAALASGRAIAFQSVEPRPQGTVFGNVTNSSAGGTPLEGASIQIIGSGRSLVSGSDGNYLGTVTTGTYVLAASCPGFAPDTTFAVTIEEFSDAEVDFQLTDIGGPAFTMTIQPESGPVTGPQDVAAMVVDPTGVNEVSLFYTSSTNGGPFALPLTLVGQTYSAVIPAQPTGTRVQYWFTASDAIGNLSAEPAGAPFEVHTFVITETSEFYSTDMETDEGWNSGIAGDGASTGLWARVDPNAVMEGTTEVSPEDDHTVAGTMCWITGNDDAGGNQGANDVDGGATTLETPVFDLTGIGGLEVSYYRWYTNDTGNGPGEDSWVVQASGDGSNWITIEETSASTRSWIPVTIQLDNYLTLGNQVQFRFIASDFGSGSVVEAGVDDFSLVGYTLAGDQAAPAVTLTSPVGGENFAPGADLDVTWNHSDDIGVVHAEVTLSLDGGDTFDIEMAAGALNGDLQWSIPGIASTTCRIRVTVYDVAGNSTSSISPADFSIDATSPVPDALASTFALAQNAPNPFNPRTEIKFSLSAAGDTELAIYNIEGKLVRKLVTDVLEAGSHTVFWDGDNTRGAKVASGLYFYRLTTKEGTLTRKMTLLK
jgi:hypothetical protein